MQAVLLVLAVEIGIAIGVVAGWLVSRRADPSPSQTDVTPHVAEEAIAWLEELEARAIVVHTTDDRSIEGLLVGTTADWMLLRSAKLLGTPSTELGGEVRIPRLKVLFVQYVPAATPAPTTSSAPAALVALP